MNELWKLFSEEHEGRKTLADAREVAPMHQMYTDRQN